MLRVGVIGLGVGAHHAAAYAASASCELRVLCDIAPATLKRIGGRFPLARLTTRWREVIEDPAIDAVSICTPDDQHTDLVLAAIDAGKHVFVEKPMCLTLDELRQIREALRRRPAVQLGSNLPLRASPRFQRVRAMARAGELGSVFHIEADYLYGRLSKLTDGWRGRIPGYSVVLGGAVHMVDLVLWLTGTHVEEVMAYGNNIASRMGGVGANDHVTALMRCRDGMTAKVSANFGCVRPHEHVLTVYGTKATFSHTRDCGVLHDSRDPGALPKLIDDPHPGDRRDSLIHAFAAAALGEGDAIVPVDDVFRTMCVCLAIDRSAHVGRPVQVEYV